MNKHTSALPMIAFVSAQLCNGSVCSSQPAGQAQTQAQTKTQTAVSSERQSFESAGHTIATEWYRSSKPTTTAIAAAGKNAKFQPVLVILHGSGGIEPDGGFFRDMAEKISQKGNIVVIVHYMDRSKLQWASNSQMSANFQTWVQTVHDAVTFIAKQPGVDPARISFFGHSLGAQLALHEAANDPRIHSIIDMAGCFVLPTSSIKRMPEVLIWQGTADKVVPLAREKSTVKVLERTHTKYTEVIFPGADHTFQKVNMDRLVKSATDFLK